MNQLALKISTDGGTRGRCRMMDMNISEMLSSCHALDVSEEVVVGTSEVHDVVDAQEGTGTNHCNEIICIYMSKYS